VRRDRIGASAAAPAGSPSTLGDTSISSGRLAATEIPSRPG
jgi:hypothetical protein